MLKRLLLFFFLAGFMNTVQAEETLPQMEPIRKLHLRGVEGDKKAVDEALTLLEPLYQDHPDNAVFRVYRGSCLTLKGRDVYWPPKKLDYAREGFSEMDKAVEMDPENKEVRFIRAMCGLNVPKFFNRLDESIEDFDFLVSILDQADHRDEDGAMIYYYAAKGYLKADNKEKAALMLKKSIAMDSGTRWKTVSQKLLDQL